MKLRVFYSNFLPSRTGFGLGLLFIIDLIHIDLRHLELYVPKAHFLNVAIGVQEWGDRSMLATIALGAAQVEFGTSHHSMFKILCSIYLPVNFIVH